LNLVTAKMIIPIISIPANASVVGLVGGSVVVHVCGVLHELHVPEIQDCVPVHSSVSQDFVSPFELVK